MLLFSLAACQREVSFDDPLVNTPQTPTTNDSMLLAKLVYLDTTLPHPKDTIYAYQFTYGSNKKTTAIRAWSYSGGIYKTEELFNYFYNPGDTLPYTKLLPRCKISRN